MREILTEWHHIPVEFCYRDNDIRRIVALYVSGDFPMVVFGHRVRDIANVAKAFTPDACELAAYRHPDEITWSEYSLARKDPTKVGHDEALMMGPEEWAVTMEHTNPILTTLGHCRPDLWLTFHDIVSAYHQVCEAAGWSVMQSVLNECLRQTPPVYHDLGNINADDLSFMQSINLQLPSYYE